MKKYFPIILLVIVLCACNVKTQKTIENTAAETETITTSTQVDRRHQNIKIYKTTPPDTALMCELIVTHDECTACLDIYFNEGDLKFSDEIKKGVRKTEIEGYARSCTDITRTSDLLLENDSVFQLLFGQHDDSHFERQYKVTGEIVGVRDSCDLVFRIYTYKRLKDLKF